MGGGWGSAKAYIIKRLLRSNSSGQLIKEKEGTLKIYSNIIASDHGYLNHQGVLELSYLP